VDGATVGYARRGEVYVAYQVLGDGPTDLLALTNGTAVSIDRDDEPHWSRFERRLASFARVIRFDPCGFGLSDPLVGGSRPTIDGWMQDAIAVLDAVGSAEVGVFGVGEGGVVALMLAATYPERTATLILMHAWARLIRDADYPAGIPKSLVERFVESVTDPDDRGDGFDDVALMAPSLAHDAEFRSWWRHAGQRGASPATARAMHAMTTSADLRSLLSTIVTPTLVLHRVDNDFIRIGHARYLAEHIAGAELVELPGRDHVPFAGEIDELSGEIEEFLTGYRTAPTADRVLATVLFTDIVDSTSQASTTGDRRWRDLLDDHDRMIERQIRRFGGRRIKTTGDGALATFDGPVRAVHCGLAIRDGARQLGLAVRVGIHTGEIERRGEDIAGIGVHIAARVQSCAQPGEVWVSRTVTDVVAGSDIAFTDRGTRELKGIPGPWQLYSAD
jgi:class 3 adenylate cyclase